MNKGVYLAFLTAIISGFAVFLNKFAIVFWQNSSVFTTVKNLAAAIFLVAFLLLLKKLPELRKLSRRQWTQLIIIGFVGGALPFLLFFKGLSLSSAVNAAFIHKTLFVWVAILAVPFLKEKISGLQFIALGILLAGVYLFSSSGHFRVGYGELLVFLATLLWAVENVIAKKALKNMSAVVVGWGRMFFGSVFLLIYLLVAGSAPQLWELNSHSWGWLILSGVILFGYVLTWYSALKFAPATVVTSVLVLAAPITAMLNSVFVTRQVSADLFLPVGLMIVGSLIISKIYEQGIAAFRKIRATS